MIKSKAKNQKLIVKIYNYFKVEYNNYKAITKKCAIAQKLGVKMKNIDNIILLML